ncbi:glycosyltransferase family 2 protein [Pontibacter sp. 13R65]|uniref:glycosyltransferase family 2 protein n=1 Tax=Pontibacter sp. 13R65 TaxID=3127458 RepID=UPI00301CD5FE
MKKVAVIIINYNSTDFTISCINSILEKTPESFEYGIVVVDNNSQIAAYEHLQEALKDNNKVGIYRSKINLGFSGGNMFGLQHAQAGYYFFLNNDCELLNDNLSMLYDFMQQHPEAAIACGQMFNTDLSPHHSFNYLPELSLKLFGSGIVRLFNKESYPKKKATYTQPLKVPLLTGAALFVDYKKLSEVSGLDTNYFLYCEEEDLARKLKDKGYSCYLVPEAKFVHHMGQSTSRSYDIEKEYYISLLYYHRKHNNYLAYLLFKGLYFFKNFRKLYKGSLYLKLSLFILRGAPMKYSLKHRQQIAPR